MLYVCGKHFTDDCFLNLGQYRAGFAERLKIKSQAVPTLLGSATNLRQVSQLTLYYSVALLYVVTLFPVEWGCSVSSTANSPITVANVKVDSIRYVCEYTHCNAIVVHFFVITVLLLVLGLECAPLLTRVIR